MKPKFSPFTATAFAVLTFVISSSAQAQTWDASFSRLWSDNDNWSSVPAFTNTTDLLFSPNSPVGMVANGNSMVLGTSRTARSLTFAADVDGPMLLTLQATGGGAASSLTMDSDAGNAALTVASDATGDITIGNAGFSGTPGFVVLADNLQIDHNGSGLLLFNRGIQGATFGITKTGTGRAQTNSFNSFTGAINVNQGTLIANTFGSNGEDLNAASAINLGGGILEIGASTGTNKTYATVPVNVNAASTLTYRNVNAATFTAQFTGAGAFALNADLAVKNASTTTTVVNGINIGRAITVTFNLLVETYNNITASADNFGLGRLLMTGSNAGVTGWNGNLLISKGTVSLGGTAVNSAGNGSINIGTTGDAFGAGVTFFPQGPNGSTVTYPNNVVVNTGGFRAIKGGGTNHSVTFSGAVTLNKDLTVDHTWGAADRRISLTGGITGAGGLTITRAAGNVETTAVLSGTGKTYTGDTTVASGASVSISTTLTSDIVVQGGRIGGPGSTNQDLSMAAGSTFFFFISPTYDAFDVTGTVTLDNGFGIASLVGGSRGEALPWNTVPNGTYTLIGTTASTFANIQNFGAGSAAPVGTGSQMAYFQNGGGTSGGGLQLVVTGGASGFDTWKTNNSAGAQTLADDHDNDGVDNGTEYFLFGNASSTGFTALPGVVDAAGTRSVTWTRALTYYGLYNIHFFVETSDTLADGSWVTAPLGSGAGQVSITGFPATSVKYTFPAGTKKFARLKVTGP